MDSFILKSLLIFLLYILGTVLYSEYKNVIFFDEDYENCINNYDMNKTLCSIKESIEDNHTVYLVKPFKCEKEYIFTPKYDYDNFDYSDIGVKVCYWDGVSEPELEMNCKHYMDDILIYSIMIIIITKMFKNMLYIFNEEYENVDMFNF